MSNKQKKDQQLIMIFSLPSICGDSDKYKYGGKRKERRKQEKRKITKKKFESQFEAGWN